MKENIFMAPEKDTSPHVGWLTEKQACAYLQASRVTLYRLRRKGEIAYSQSRRFIRYRKEDLDSYLMYNYVKSQHPP